MRQLYIIRHADYDPVSGKLTDWGREQVQNLAAKLTARLINATRLILLSSATLRALETAQIIGESLNTRIVPDEKLSCDDGQREDVQAIYDWINDLRDQTEVLLIVTHLGYAMSLPAHIGTEQNWPMESYPLFEVIEKAEAWLMDFESQSTTHLKAK